MYSLCCCCLELPSLKDLWSEYPWMGQYEIYGNMLKECFNLTWPQTEESKDQICEVCITQLRNALQFKQRVVLSQAKLEAKLVDTTNAIKEEYLEFETLEAENNLIESREISEHEQNGDLDNDNEVPSEEVKQDVFCDDTESIKIEELELPTNVPVKRRKNIIYVKRDKSKKNRKEIVKRKILIIPKKGNHKQINLHNITYVKPRQNAALIIENSTIVPFKFNKGYFTCFYCNKQHVGFDELKIHISESHENVTFNTILKSIHRPHDKIKVDVSDITCRICKKKIDNLENFVSHLTEEHDMKFIDNEGNKPTDSILAYDLGEGKFKCCICKSEFLFFKTLTTHMNSHSNDYVCDICGKCFLLFERLRTHLYLHKEEKLSKCKICDKVYASHSALRAHVRYIHSKNSYLCSICNVSFSNNGLRTRHLEEVHKRAPLNLTCKICSKNYTTSNSFNSHMRVEHLKIVRKPKHSCSVCGIMCQTPNALASHSLVHTGEKEFECEFCRKKYARAKTLREHLKIHRNDKRWSCRACAQAFVQKCSLKSHIRVHHASTDFEELIVYNKPDLDSK